MAINWPVGTPLSGFMFTMVTASGTMINVNLTDVSCQVSKDAGAWGNLATTTVSGHHTAAGVYDGWFHVNLAAADLGNWTTALKMSSALGSLVPLPQNELLVMTSGPGAVLAAVSGLKVDVSAIPGVLVATSGLKVDVSAIPGVLVATSGLKVDVSALAGILVAISGLKVDVSAIPGVLVATSGLKMDVSAIPGVLVATSGLKTDVSAIPGILVATSGLKKDLSGLPVVELKSVSGAVGLAWGDIMAEKLSADRYGLSGSIGELIKFMGGQVIGGWNIDKVGNTLKVYAAYATSTVIATFTLIDDANQSVRTPQ